MQPFRAVANMIRRLADAPGAPRGVKQRVGYVLGAARTTMAPGWRRFARWIIVILGFSIYIGMQVGLAFLIKEQAWIYITALFIIVSCFALAVSKPTLAYLIWVITCPLGLIFLRYDFGPEVPAISYDRITMMFLCSILIARTLLNRKPIRKPLFSEWLTFAFVAYSFMTLLVFRQGTLAQTLATLSEKFDYIIMAALTYYVTKAVLRTRENLVWATGALVITGIHVAASAFYEHFTGNMWFSSFLNTQIRLQFADVESGRASGSLVNPAAMGTFLGITTMLTVNLLFATRKPIMKFLYLAAIVLQVIGCYFCFTRTGYAALLILVAFMPLFARGARKQYWLIFGAAVLALAIAVPIMMSNKDLNKRMSRETTIYARLVVTYSTLRIIQHHPFFGVGLGNIDEALAENITNAGNLSGLYGRGFVPFRYYPQRKLSGIITSHNSILTIFAEQGIIGGLMYLSILVGFLVQMFRVRSWLPNKGVLGKDFVSLLILSVIGHTTSTLGYDIRFFKYPSYVLWILFAIAVRLGEIVQEERRQATGEPDTSMLLQPMGDLVHA